MERPPRDASGIPKGTLFSIQRRLLAWYDAQARDLPWRKTRDPYAILVAEVMLQQTQVDRVVPKYHQFLSLFPDFPRLAAAPVSQVIQAWAPLGYNRRAVRLHRIAQKVVTHFGGQLPPSLDELQRLEGVGPYTAAAVASFAFRADVPVLDTNVRRVLGRWFFGLERPTPSHLRAVADVLLPKGKASAWNQALMDLGATVCTSRDAWCYRCPLQENCEATQLLKAAEGRILEQRAPYKAQPFRGSTRFYRGRIVDYLRRIPDGQGVSLLGLGQGVKSGFTPEELPWLLNILQELQRDGLVKLDPQEAPDGGAVAASSVSLP